MAPLGGLPYGIGMPRSGRGAAVALAAVAVLTLSACTAPANSGPVTPPSASASPRATAVFGSDEEALAAATAAYTAYVAVSDQVAREGGARPQRLSSVVAPSLLNEELSSYIDLRSSGRRLTGASTFDSIRLQGAPRVIDGLVTLSAYVCADVSKTDVVDSNNRSVLDPSRRTRYPIEVQFVGDRPGSVKLLVERSTAWSGQDFC